MKIRVLGNATLDIILRIDSNIFEGNKIEVKEIFFSLGGGALNASTTFKNLKIDYLAYFRLGNDIIAKNILSKIKEENLKSKIFFHKGNSQFSVVVLSKNKERTIFVWRGAADRFSLNELFSLDFGKNDPFYLTTLNTSPLIFIKFLKKLKQNRSFICLNPSYQFLKSPHALGAISFADVLILNYQEACALMKKNLKPLLLGKELKNISKVKILVITLGEKGSLTFYENKIFEADVFKPKKFVDTTGAGDAFSSAFFANLFLNKFVLNEEIVRKSIIWGSANASSNIEKLGAQIGLLKKEDFFKYQSLRLKIKSWQY